MKTSDITFPLVAAVGVGVLFTLETTTPIDLNPTAVNSMSDEGFTVSGLLKATGFGLLLGIVGTALDRWRRGRRHDETGA